MKRLNRIDRFMQYVEKIPDAGCWIWMGQLVGRMQYGRFHWKGRFMQVAHRASWLMFRGGIPDGMLVCHLCDVPCCVNPHHLFLGSYSDNMQDKARKGRDVARVRLIRGEGCNFAKLTEQQARDILSAEGPQREIAMQFGISQQHVSSIKHRRCWKHLT